MLNQTFITWDLGGTKCSIALVEHDKTYDRFHLLQQHTHKLSEFHSLAELIDQFEADFGFAFTEVEGILISAAGQYDGQTVNLATPYPFPITIAAEAEARGWQRFAVVHDYVPVVCATFIAMRNPQIEYQTLYAGEYLRHGRRVAFGVGTGLGLKDGVLLPDGNFWLGTNEIGHIGIILPPQVDAEHAKLHTELCAFLRQHPQYAHIPLRFETLLSGQGFALVHQFACGSQHLVSPEEAANECYQTSQATIEIFAWYLGLFTGSVQLSFMPEAGIWIGGGVINKHPTVVSHPAFWAGIKASPNYLTEREKMPLYMLLGHQYATIGGAYYASRHFRRHRQMPQLAINL